MNAAQQRAQTLNTVILNAEAEFNGIAEAHKAVAFKAECQFAAQALQANDFLAKTALNNQQSLYNAVVNIAAIGISLNPAEKAAYLVPRDGGVCLDISYMGLIQLATNTGIVEWAQAKIVYSNDAYRNTGLATPPVHEYQPFGDRGQYLGVYVTAKLATGDYLTHEMPIADVVAIRDRSQAWKSGKSCPWKTDEKEMIRKTCVKQAYKYWPKSNPRLAKAIDVLNQESGEGIDFAQEQQVAIPQEQPLALENYPQERFELNFPKWQQAVLAGKKSQSDIIAMVESKAPLTDAQKTQILNIGLEAA